MPEAGHIVGNMRRVDMSYDEELPTPVVTDPLPYTDSSSQELIEREQEEYEKNYAAAAPQRWEKQELWQGKDNETMRLVNILHPHSVFRKLQQAGVDARIEAPSYWVHEVDNSSGKIVAVKKERSVGRLWLHDNVVNGRVGISAWVTENGIRVRKCLTSIQYPYGPEWSIMRFNEWNVPTNERYRGYRTAMLALILAGVLTEDEVNRAFGVPPLNNASWFYRRSLADFRKKQKGLIQ